MKTVSSQEKEDLALSLGTHLSNRPLSPMEAADICVRLSQTYTLKQISELCVLKRTDMVYRITKLSTLNSDLHHIVDWGSSSKTKIGMSVALEITRLDDIKKQNLLANISMKHKLSKKELKDIISFVNPSSTYLSKPMSFEEAVKEILNNRPVKREVHIIIGSIIDRKVTSQLDKLSQTARDKLLHQLISSIYSRDKEWDCSLGPKRFTLSVNSDFMKFISRKSKDLESYVTNLLKSELK